MTVAIVPRIPRKNIAKRKSRCPLLLQLILLRFRLRATLWRAEAGSLLLLAWLFAKLQAIRTARRLLNAVLPPRR